MILLISPLKKSSKFQLTKKRLKKLSFSQILLLLLLLIGCDVDLI